MGRTDMVRPTRRDCAADGVHDAMTDKSAFLVVGGDSLVGHGVVGALERRGYAVFASTRRCDTLGPRRVYLDFESDDLFAERRLAPTTPF